MHWSNNTITTIVTAALVLLGQYKGIEKLSSILAIALSLAVLTAAFSIFPNPRDLAAGLIPQFPQNVQYQEVLPWLGFMLAGAAGLMWYSYWIKARGYGAAALKTNQPIDPKTLSQKERRHLQDWLTQMTLSNTLAVFGALLIAFAFLILGGELLRPKGFIPEENKIAETLGRLLGDIWGPFGFWFMIIAVLVTFCSTALSDQDGFGRMFADGTNIILRSLGVQGRWMNETVLQRIYLVILLAILPIAIYLIFGEPVGLLQMAGVIEAAHIPIVTGLTLYLNHRLLPKELQPSKFTLVITAIAGLFFGVFAIVYLLQLVNLL